MSEHHLGKVTLEALPFNRLSDCSESSVSADRDATGGPYTKTRKSGPVPRSPTGHISHSGGLLPETKLNLGQIAGNCQRRHAFLGRSLVYNPSPLSRLDSVRTAYTYAVQDVSPPTAPDDWDVLSFPQNCAGFRMLFPLFLRDAVTRSVGSRYAYHTIRH